MSYPLNLKEIRLLIGPQYYGDQPDVEMMNSLIVQMSSAERGQLSDEYHTFNELYEHRITLFIAVCRQISQQLDGMGADYLYEREDIWRSKLHSDGSGYEGWFILGIDTEPGKQITYHLPMIKWGLCDFAQEREKAPEFDGHTSADVLTRINKL